MGFYVYSTHWDDNCKVAKISNSQLELLSINLFQKDLTQSTRRSRGRKEFLIFYIFFVSHGNSR